MIAADGNMPIRQMPSGEHDGPPPTPSLHRRERGWTLHTCVKRSSIPGAGNGLWMCEKAKKGDRIARYYGELIGPEEAMLRKRAGAQYILRVNANQYLDGETFKNQQGCYANDGGPGTGRNHVKLAQGTPNRCPITGVHWVSITTKRTIGDGEKVFVSYGKCVATRIF